MANSKDEKREAILEAAFEAFKTYGLRKMTLEDVAAKVGMATSSLYYYFDSKKKLFQALLDNEKEKLFSAKRVALARAVTTEEKILALWTTQSDTLDRFEDLTPTELKNLQDSIWEAREFISKWQIEHERMTQEILDQGIEEGIFEVVDTGQAAFVISMAMRGLFSELISDGQLNRLQMAAETLTRLILQGLKKR
jgi:AcrR family transcriptional regulator